MPNRILRSGLLTSDAMNSLSAEEERLFTRLLLAVDDFGRFDARPAIIRGVCFPLAAFPLSSIAEWLHGISLAGLIRIYEVEGRYFLQIAKWREAIRAKVSKYPNPLDDRTCAQLPAPAKHLSGDARLVVVVDGIGDVDEEPSVADAPAQVEPPAQSAPDKPHFDLKPTRAAKPKAASVPDQPELGEYIARFRTVFASPDADLTGRGVFVWRTLRKKHGTPKLLQSIDGCHRDPHARSWTLQEVCSQKGVERGLKPRESNPGLFAAPPDNRPVLQPHTPAPRLTPEEVEHGKQVAAKFQPAFLKGNADAG